MLDHVADKLERYMGLLSTRQKLVASNIANIDTPGYKTRDIDFQSQFLSRINDGKPPILEPDLPSKNDGNNVNIDRETRMLAETGIRFQTAALLARGQFKMVRSAIAEGKGG